MIEGMTVTSYRYSLLAPLDWGDDCDLELRKANALWNRLVEIEQAHRERVRAVAADDADVTRAKAAYDAVAAEYDPLLKRRKALRGQARRCVAMPDLDVQISSVRERRAAAAKLLREASRHAYQAAHDVLRALEHRRQAEVKRARQNSGLHFGTYNAVIQSFDVGRQRVLKAGATMRFRRFDGTGRITQQIIDGMGLEELKTAARSQVCLGPDPQDKGGKIRALRLAVYYRDRVPREVTWPIVWHRELPEGARIQQVVVHKTSRGGRTMWHAVFSLRVPGTPGMRGEGAHIAINLGWRQTPAGTRVATASRDDGGDHIMLPDAVVRRLKRCEQDTAERDRRVNQTIAWLCTLDCSTAPPALRQYLHNLLRAPKISPRALYRLLALWRGEPSWRADSYARLREWQITDRIIWREREGRRAHALAARREHYRLEARRVMGDAREIVINEHDMSGTARVEDTELPVPARAHRVLAAPSELRTAIIEYAHKAGIGVTIRSLPNDVCARCGRPFVTADRAQLHWQCASGHIIDQDENYCRLLLTEALPASRERSGDVAPAGPPRGDEKAPISTPSGGGRWSRLKAMRSKAEMNRDRSNPAARSFDAAGEDA